MNMESKLSVCLFSDPNFLAVNILEILLSKNCVVYIVSDNKDGWVERTKYLNKSLHFSIIDEKKYFGMDNFSYAVFCGGFINKSDPLGGFKKFNLNKNLTKAKTLAIFPFETFSLKSSSQISISNNAGIIYVGDLMGPRIDLNSELLLPVLISEMVSQRSLTLGVGEIFYPIFVADAARSIVKWLLSFGPYGKETFLMGSQMSSGDFWKQNLKSIPDLKVVYDSDIETRFVPRGYDITTISSNPNICFNETYKWIVNEKIFPTNSNIRKIKNKTIERPQNAKNARKIKPFILPLFLILLFPLFSSILSGGLLYLSYKQFMSEKINNALNLSQISKKVFVISRMESDVLAKIPLLGKFYDEMSYISWSGEMVADLSVNIIPAVESGREILVGVLDTGTYDVKTPFSRIKASLDYTYQRISFYQIVTKEKNNLGLYSAKQILQIVDFEKLKNLFRAGGILTERMPDVLGMDTNKNYLILFENNMELRPTGGFIGSYGVANFGGGKMNGLNINDIYSADGQLKGHIEPPYPIKKYLNEANWWFRDSNWNPDFPTSAERAEWFLNKEMDQKVDGVVAIDLEPIKNLLKYTGPIFLPDYNLTISSDNLYEKTQEEAQANSFPGSRQKASFLTALSRSIISNISKMGSKDKFLVLKAFYEGLVGRHVQVYLHDVVSAEAIDKLGWDGKIQSYSCGEACYSDFFGVVEANVGVNKSNYFIKRKFDFNINLTQKRISRSLTINLENTANPDLGLSGIHKNYLRVMLPADANLISVKSVNGQNVKKLTPEITQEKGRQEVGVYIEINPKATTNIIFEWQNDLLDASKISNYGLYVRKQAGIGNDPISIKFKGVGKTTSSPTFSLTDGGAYAYNTDLMADFFARLSWK